MHTLHRVSLTAALAGSLLGTHFALPTQDSGGQATLADQSMGIPVKGPAPVDVFHPDRDTDATPLYGGRVIVHSTSVPKHMNYVTENSAYTRRMLYEVHETLLHEDWEEHEMQPLLAESWNTEDMLVLKAGTTGIEGAREVRVANPSEAEGAPEHVKAQAIYGRVTDVGSDWKVEATSAGHPLGKGGVVFVPKAVVDRLERGTVFNFVLREGVLWHPAEGHPVGSQILNAQDVQFSWSIYSNSHVECDEKRFQFEKITGCEVIDDLHVRFFYEAQYAFAEGTIGKSMTILPSHIYNLADTDNKAFKEEFTATEQAELVNHNPHNSLWIGLGPYRITKWNDSFVEAVRFTDEAGKSLYFDASNAGFVDTIRWRVIEDDETAMNALLNGELDFFERVKSEDYFGARTGSADFKKNFYKGFKYGGSYGYTGWNMLRPQLKDLAVRQAIELSFDMEKYRLTNYKGLANRITGPFPFGAAAYNHDVKPRGQDVEAAIDLLDDAGWYDRDFDGVRDKNGVALSITLSYPSGNDASKNFGLALQESLAELEIELKLEQLEWATFLDRIKKREFDACNLAWVPDLESDPEQVWHSKWGAPDVQGSNNSAVMDPFVDALIAKGQTELDHGKRQEIWRELHRYLYEEIVPYLFMYNIPRKFAMSRKLHGFQVLAIDPGYVIRRWHYIDPKVAGTRKTLNP